MNSFFGAQTCETTYKWNYYKQDPKEKYQYVRARNGYVRSFKAKRVLLIFDTSSTLHQKVNLLFSLCDYTSLTFPVKCRLGKRRFLSPEWQIGLVGTIAYWKSRTGKNEEPVEGGYNTGADSQRNDV